ncbi:MAG: hypothetical protein A3C84_01125 [Candidatus Ryanbacteria bacterium RIFCSPHIGHO2_02_FULL_48_12]|uniref:Uncharacterized protein n=1 Tax=Candidatus Ryanbacteria bacterium RIFCSPHIGHO2_01_FULL_48_27 TaxID=1802115 RepID=A0A1G2G3W2_9BACT|nr:MAG: hypothetical protein A2756_03635 [Candidatus Ryanbacteria bacterium RIFCSPHIGHO2_01_FULL_48_27]OGZ50716.1 MAG: hypothetical protein A3C84_01125 [Candidatus Ryanbacteria bacterium RIFCSPHIGHO2_02_FULL_48_12]
MKDTAPLEGSNNASPETFSGRHAVLTEAEVEALLLRVAPEEQAYKRVETAPEVPPAAPTKKEGVADKPVSVTGLQTAREQYKFWLSRQPLESEGFLDDNQKGQLAALAKNRATLGEEYYQKQVSQIEANAAQKRAKWEQTLSHLKEQAEKEETQTRETPPSPSAVPALDAESVIKKDREPDVTASTLEELKPIDALDQAQEHNETRLRELQQRIINSEHPLSPEEGAEHRARMKLAGHLSDKTLEDLTESIREGDAKHQSTQWRGREAFVEAVRLAQTYGFDPDEKPTKPGPDQQKSLTLKEKKEKIVPAPEAQHVAKKTGALVTSLEIPATSGTTKTLTKTASAQESPSDKKTTTPVPLSVSIETTNKEQTPEQAFQDIFHISREELKSIKGFEALSEGKKLFVLRNLEELTHGRIQTDAATAYKEDSTEAKFLGRVWRSFREGVIGKDYQIAKLEKKTKEAILGGGMELHEATIRKLTEIAANNPDTHIGSDGSLRMDYIGSDELLRNNSDMEERRKTRQVISAFNHDATYLASLPKNVYVSGSREARKEYAAAQKAYAGSRKALLAAATKFFGDTQQAILFVAARDAKVHINQFLNANPEVETQLHAIDSKSTWREVTRGFARHGIEKGLYAGLGAVTNYATYGILGAATTGAVRGSVHAVRQFNASKKEGAHGLTRKEKITTPHGPLKKTDFVDAENLTTRMGALLEKLEASTAPEQQEIAKKHLARLTAFAARKYESGFVNFGTDELSGRYDILQKIAEAEAYLHTQGYASSAEKSKHLDLALNRHASRVSRERWNHIRSQAVKGFAVGLTFGTLGQLARTYAPVSFSRAHESVPDLSQTKVPGIPEDLEEKISRQKVEEALLHTKGSQLETRAATLEKTIKPGARLYTEAPAPKSSIATGETGSPAKPQVLELPPLERPTATPHPTEVTPLAPKEIPKDAFVETARKGDSVWKMIERQLAKPHVFGDKFARLPEAQRIYVIDAFKDRVVAHPEEFGLKNPDLVKIEQSIDFEKLFARPGDLARALDDAEHHMSASMRHMEHAEETLKAWSTAHKGTPPQIRDIDEALAQSKGQTPGMVHIIETDLPESNESTALKSAEPEQTSVFLRTGEDIIRKRWDMTPTEYNEIRNIPIGEFESTYRADHTEDLRTHNMSGEALRRRMKLAEFIRGHAQKTARYTPAMTVRQFFEYLSRQNT